MPHDGFNGLAPPGVRSPGIRCVSAASLTMCKCSADLASLVCGRQLRRWRDRTATRANAAGPSFAALCWAGVKVPFSLIVTDTWPLFMLVLAGTGGMSFGAVLNE